MKHLKKSGTIIPYHAAAAQQSKISERIRKL
jgi:hypothetical protein